MSDSSGITDTDVQLFQWSEVIEDYLRVLVPGAQSRELPYPTNDEEKIVREWVAVFDEEIKSVRATRNLLVHGRRMIAGRTVDEAAEVAARLVSVLRAKLRTVGAYSPGETVWVDYGLERARAVVEYRTNNGYVVTFVDGTPAGERHVPMPGDTIHSAPEVDGAETESN